MTIADAHAVALLTCPILTAAALLASRRRPTEPRPGLFELLVPLVVVFFSNLNQHGCDERAGAVQTLIPLACMWAVLFWCGPMLARWGIAMLLAGAACALTHHAIELVHTNSFTGVADLHKSGLARIGKDRELLSKQLAQLGESDTFVYEARWLRELPFAHEIPMLDARPAFYESATALWHTRFTGLHRRELHLLDYWYPGGALADAAEKLELSTRPEAPVKHRPSSRH